MNKPKIFFVCRTPKDIDGSYILEPKMIKDQFCACINVSDSICATFDLQEIGMPSYWFPINEIAQWTHAPFYGALKVVNKYFTGDKPVLIHCHAGANRSPSVAYAILLTKGYTPQEAEESLNYPDLHDVFERNVDRKHIPKNVIEFLKASDDNPEITSLASTLRKLDSLFDEFAVKRFQEQNDYALGKDSEDNTRLVYNKEKKRFIIVKD